VCFSSRDETNKKRVGIHEKIKRQTKSGTVLGEGDERGGRRGESSRRLIMKKKKPKQNTD